MARSGIYGALEVGLRAVSAARHQGAACDAGASWLQIGDLSDIACLDGYRQDGRRPTRGEDALRSEATRGSR